MCTGGRKRFLADDRVFFFVVCTFFARVLPVYRLYYYYYHECIYIGKYLSRVLHMASVGPRRWTGFSSVTATGGRAGLPARHCCDVGDKKKTDPVSASTKTGWLPHGGE